MDRVECVVVGAGIVGLAAARALARAGREVVILEAEEAIGTHTSSRNSEVIHAGIYYPRGSLKARACVAGRHRLYEYCESHGVPHRRCGKLIVATSDAQMAELEQGVPAPRALGIAIVFWEMLKLAISTDRPDERSPEVYSVGDFSEYTYPHSM